MSRECPPWCGQGHLCGANGVGPVGQHRSAPRRAETAYGLLVWSRVQNHGSARSQLEVRLVVLLDVDEHTAQRQAEHVATDVDQAVTLALLAGEWVTTT